MIVISHPSLPTRKVLPQNEGAVLAIISLLPPNNYASLCEISTRKPTEAIARTLPAYTGNTAEIDVSGLELAGIEAIEIAGRRYMPGFTPNDLQPGQFFWNYYTNKIIVKFGNA